MAKSEGFLMGIKICSMASFGGRVKLSAPCHKILWYVKDPCEV
jgi:hypothetical protein